MYRLDLDRPAPTLAAWARTARPVRIGHLHEDRSQRQHVTSGPARLDDILFGFSAAMLLLVALVGVPLAAWLR